MGQCRADGRGQGRPGVDGRGRGHPVVDVRVGGPPVADGRVGGLPAADGRGPPAAGDGGEQLGRSVAAEWPSCRRQYAPPRSVVDGQGSRQGHRYSSPLERKLIF